MQFKMSERSLFAVLLRSPWWVSFAVAVAVGVAAYNLFPSQYAAVGAVSGLPFAVIGAMAAWRQRGQPSAARVEATLQSLAAMSGRDFAEALATAYERDGYAVTRLSLPGAELAVSKAGRTAVVQGKRCKAATHGLEPLRELASAMEAQEAGQGIYVAINTPGEAARQFASKNGIRLLQGVELAKLMASANPNIGKPAKAARPAARA